MKRWWWLLAIIALFFVGDRLGATLLAHLLDRSPQRFCRLYAGELDGKIACAGNSRGVVDLHVPSIAAATGKTVVNISHNGMTPEIARAIVEDYLEHNPKPELLVIEVSFVTSDTTEAGVLEYMPYWGHSKRLVDLGERFAHREVIAGEVSHLYRFNSELCLRVLIYLARGRSDQVSGMTAELSSALVEEINRLAPFKVDVYPQEVAALVEIVSAARQAGVEVRLVFAPYLPAYAAKITNLDEIVALLTKKTGTKVFDFSRGMKESALFADRVHLDPAGSREFTKMMVEAGVFEPITKPEARSPKEPAPGDTPAQAAASPAAT